MNRLPHPLTHPTFITQLSITGLALLVASVLYLVGANWFLIPDGVQIGITTTLMAGFGLAGLRLTGAFKDATETASAAMIGLTLAVIGQVYQTGADSFWLFAIWSVLLVPWLYRSNVGVFVLFCVVLQLALWLFLDQTHMFDGLSRLLVMSLLALGLFGASLRHYPKLIYPFVLWFGVLSLMAVFSLNDAFDDASGLVILADWLTVFLAPVVGIWYAKQKNKPLAVSLGVSSLAVSLFTYVALQVFGEINEIGMAVLSVVWFGVVGALLFKLFPKGKFHAIPMGLGGWFAGLFLTVFFLSAFFLSPIPALIFALIFVGISIMLLVKAKDVIFLRHLGYCLMATGQAVFYASLYDVLHFSHVTPFILLQSIMLGLCHRLGVHWLYLLGQMLGLYGLIYVDFMTYFEPISDLGQQIMLGLGVLPVLGLFANHHLTNGIHRALAVFVMVALTIFGVSHTFGTSQPMTLAVLFGQYHQLLIILPILAVLLYQLYQAYPHQRQALIGFGVLALGLGLFGHAQIFFALILLAFAIKTKDKLLNALSMVVFIGLLWQLYYALSVPFLYKFISIFIGGALVLGLSRWLQYTQTKTQAAPTTDTGASS